MASESTSDDAGQSSGFGPSRVEIDRTLKAILVDVLGIAPDDADSFVNDTGLFGHRPELDSMAVAGLFTEIEDRFDILIDDDDVEAEMLETYGGLLAFVEMQVVES